MTISAYTKKKKKKKKNYIPNSKVGHLYVGLQREFLETGFVIHGLLVISMILKVLK